MTKDQITATIAEHTKWLRCKGGKRAVLRGSDLSGANLSYSDLSGANLSGSNLRGSDLSDSNLRGAKINDKTALGIIRRATRADGYEFFLWQCEGGFFIKAGCRFMDMETARQHWTNTRAGTPLGAESQDILDFFAAAIAKATGD